MEVQGHQPRHVSKIEPEICGDRCLVVDGVRVPFPDCSVHGGWLGAEKLCH